MVLYYIIHPLINKVKKFFSQIQNQLLNLKRILNFFLDRRQESTMIASKISITFIIATIFVSGILSQESQVQSYDDNLFATELAKHKVAMVAFYAPWCHYSQGLLPEYDAASFMLRFLPEASMIKVDCWTTASKTCLEQQIAGYPTIKLFNKGVFYKTYNGPRKSYEIISELFTTVSALRRL